jgi:membrane-bound lytic murein transglycosylase D
LKFFTLVRKYIAFLWALGFKSAIARRATADGLWTENSARRSNSTPRALISGTVFAVLTFIALTAIFPEPPPTAADVSLISAENLVAVDPDLVLGPGPGKLGDGPLIKRALALANNPKVRVQLEYLLTDKRNDILAALSLSTRYIQHIAPILEKYDLPPELVYLCIIESGYRQSARSHAGAVGMWQMIRSTSSRFDLKTNTWVDERLDFMRSTEGAASFIQYLLKRFDNWDHVLAAYNAGEGRVARAAAKAVRRGLDPEMENLRLPRETRIYVPAFYAVLLIAMEPERYGLFPDYQPPLDYIEVLVPGGVSLSTIAGYLGCDIKELNKLNPSILRGRIPISGEVYPLRVPCTVGEGKARAVAASLKEVRYVSYRVRKGDTLWDISRKFGVSISRITLDGRHRGNSSRIFPGETLLVALTAGEAS